MAPEKQKSSPLFFNRELSWIEFNNRVLKEAQNKKTPLFERIRFLSIVSSNFDEFFMVRLAGLKNQAELNSNWKDDSGLSAKEQIDQISVRAHEIFETQHRLFNEEIMAALKKEGLVYVTPQEFTDEQKHYAENFFREQVYPLLTPLRTDEDELPPIANLRIHVAFLLKPITNNERLYKTKKNHEGSSVLALVQVPTTVDRIIWFPSQSGEKNFTLIDNIISTFGTSLFSGYTVEETLVFKVVCDADFAVNEEVEDDFIQAMKDVLIARKKAIPIRLTCTSTGSTISQLLIEKTGLKAEDIYSTDTPFIDLKSFNSLCDTDGYAHLCYPSWKNFYPSAIEQKKPLWDTLKQKDLLIHAPYESFDPVLTLVNDAAEDVNVMSIKMTLYRTSGNSPLIKSLIKAARNGKQVTVFVELKARFDEERNISWAHQLQQEGAIVLYGLAHLKVHAKLLLIVRKESTGMVRYVHLGTGNYNEKTARLYVDMSLFTTNIDIANDVGILFNMISGYSAVQNLNRLFIAPIQLKSQIISMIEREILCSTKENPGLIIAKMNSLAHPDIIRALYKASCSHVSILLNIRGICMLVPGVKEQSKNIRVTSIVDRYLEHTRIFYFQNGGSEELYLSSADWMPRNLERRIEVMFPILDKDIAQGIKKILKVYFSDNQKSHDLKSDGSWVINKNPAEQPIRAQEEFYNYYKKNALVDKKKSTKEFTVRRNISL